MRTTTLDPRYLIPPHEVRDGDHLAALIAAMQVAGWRGRPLLVRPYGDGWQALTGSHRIAAARQAELDQVPVLAIEPYDLDEDGWDAMERIRDDEELEAALRAAGLDAAADLVAEEIAANEA